MNGQNYFLIPSVKWFLDEKKKENKTDTKNKAVQRQVLHWKWK